jgi:hypothetical protein
MSAVQNPVSIPIYGRKGVVAHALVDAQDAERVQQHRWNRSGGYAQTQITSGNRKVNVRMHNLIMGKEAAVDHKDRNPLNNCRSNLRFTSKTVVNGQNRNKNKNKKSSKYLGVYPTPAGTFYAKCGHGGKSKRLGTFAKEEHAAFAYDEYCRSNFPHANVNGVEKPVDYVQPPPKTKKKEDKNLYAHNGKFVVEIKGRNCGTFATIEEARLGRDLKWLDLINEDAKKTEQEYSVIMSRSPELDANGNAIIRLSNTKEVALVDRSNWHELMLMTPSWYKNSGGYAQAGTNDGRLILMHRYLMFDPPGKIVDHHDVNKLNNCLGNLRVMDRNDSLQAHNKRKRPGCSTDFLGVSVHKQTKKFSAEITCDGIRHKLGIFSTAEEAARIRDAKALELYGQGARFNFNDEKQALDTPDYRF